MGHQKAEIITPKLSEDLTLLLKNTQNIVGLRLANVTQNYFLRATVHIIICNDQ